MKRCYIRGLTFLGIINTATGCLFNFVLCKHVDKKTDNIVRWSFRKATDFPREDDREMRNG